MTAPRSPSLRDSLRAQTRDLHEQFDAAFRPESSSWSPRRYGHLVTLLHSLHASADPLLATWQRAVPGFPPVLARTAPFLADLTFLGGRPSAPLGLDDLPRDEAGRLTQPAGWGLLYVVAGSSLGGQTVLRQLPPSVAPGARNGLTACASESAAAVWRATLTLLATSRPAADTAGAVEAGRRVFTRLLERLAPVDAL